MMESIFFLGEGERAAFLRHMLQSFRSTYVCLWSYSPLTASNCLVFLDGFYDEEIIQQLQPLPSSSTATRLFNEYCGSPYYIDYGCVPGFAFKNNIPYLEMKVDYLQTMVATQTQMQFYREAGIKTAVFMGCPTGEIELGFSNNPHEQVNLQMEIQRWFPADFSRQMNPATASSSSSSSLAIAASSSSSYSREEVFQLSMSIPHHHHHNLTTTTPNPEMLQFPAMATTHQDPPAITRNLQRHELHGTTLTTTTTTPSESQTQHMIAERRRREKINDSIQILKSLLPHVSKKDKASVLSNTTKYLSSLRSQMGELKRRNVVLEMQLSAAQRESGEEELGVVAAAPPPPPTGERVNVEIGHVGNGDPSTSDDEARLILDLRISLRSRECSLSDLVARVLGFLKQNTNVVSLLSVQSNTTLVESTPIHALLLRIKILHQGDGFDESGFREAVRRVVDT